MTVLNNEDPADPSVHEPSYAGLPEPRLWYDPETQRCSSMAPLRPTYEPLWDEQDMRAAIAAEREQMNGLRRSVAEVIGEDQDTWPDHGNAPLAIAATVALLHARCTRLEAELSTLREQLAESESERMESYRQGDKIRPVR